MRGFVLSTQSEFVGGFGKWPEHNPGENYACVCMRACMFVCVTVDERS